jgi:uncharacterized membrane protein
MSRPKKQKSAARYLLQILINLVIAIAIIICGFLIDSAIFSNPPEGAQGHGMPIFSMLLMFVAAGFFVISTVVCIIKAIIAAKRKKQMAEY